MSIVLDEVTRAAARLAAAGVDSPRCDAEQIAAHVHDVQRRMLHTVPDAEFDARFWADVARREAREPLQHIIGRAYFRYLELEVGPGVFVPRPETEVMTGWAIDQLRAMDAVDPLVVDLGTGSGAIALAIAQEVPRARVHAVEADRLAHAWAQRNVERNLELITRYANGATAGHQARAAGPQAPRVALHLADLATALPEFDEAVDLVISNPPYIPDGAGVPPEVGDYDPPAALWGGPDGLDTIRRLERTAARLLRPGGLVAVEHGSPQGAAVYWVFPESAGWCDRRNNRDLAGRDRFVTARRATAEREFDLPDERPRDATDEPLHEHGNRARTWQDGRL
ncbi:MAG TPA: peptide chain release factor N(5)-glutamine methyltransferase [Streptosporangiaceae bacterium]|nr:peptide chain release factor N(5)-glutamine methyltransferase [Streptosporangiaceae bacterium]